MQMTNKQVVAGMAVAMALLPVIASAQTTDVQSQIQALLSQIQTLQQQLRALVASSTPSYGVGSGWMMGSTTAPAGQQTAPGQLAKARCVALNRDIGLGTQGSDVSALQQMLSDDPESGYTAGVTGYFGPLTAAAMARFQEHNGIASSTTGWVGPLTRGFFERECGRGIGENENGQYSPMIAAFAGTITAADSASITVQNAGGISKKVNVTASTTIQAFTGTSTAPTTGSVANLVVGAQVAVDGSLTGDGSINAVHIRVGFPAPAAPMMNQNGQQQMGGENNARRGYAPMFFNPFMPHNNAEDSTSTGDQ